MTVRILRIKEMSGTTDVSMHACIYSSIHLSVREIPVIEGNQHDLGIPSVIPSKITVHITSHGKNSVLLKTFFDYGEKEERGSEATPKADARRFHDSPWQGDLQLGRTAGRRKRYRTGKCAQQVL
jgi:hypothetical protein